MVYYEMVNMICIKQFIPQKIIIKQRLLFCSLFDFNIIISFVWDEVYKNFEHPTLLTIISGMIWNWDITIP